MGARAKATIHADGTRLQLILAGERLFARQGIDNVSLRQINAEANQRNSSAAHYHFGSKDSLVAAIHAYRMDRITARRNQLVRQLVASGGADDPRTLVSALVLPFVEEIREHEAGRNYVLFLAQLHGHPTADAAAPFRCQFAEEVGEVQAALRPLYPQLPDEIFNARYGLLLILMLRALADRVRAHGSAPAGAGAELPELFISNLLDAMVGMLGAPMSPETAAGIPAAAPAGP